MSVALEMQTGLNQVIRNKFEANNASESLYHGKTVKNTFQFLFFFVLLLNYYFFNDTYFEES